MYFPLILPIYRLFHRLLIASLLSVFILIPCAQGLSDAELEQVRDGFEARRDAYLTGYLEAPFFEFGEGVDTCRQHLQDAQWIWYPGESGRKAAPIGIRYFKREITIPVHAQLKQAYCAFAADNFCDITINGKEIGRAGGFNHAKLYDITQDLQPGVNVLEVAGHNAGDAANPAGLLALVHVDFATGDPLFLVSDENWQVSQNPDENVEWKSAQVLGAAGCGPWGKVSMPLDVRVSRYVFSRLCYALAALHLDTDREAANAAILDAVAQVRLEQQSVGEFGLHWLGGAFYRIYGLFGPDGALEGRMSDEAVDAVWQLFADYARDQAPEANHDPGKVWRIWGSENHGAQRDATLWAATRMIAQDPRGKDFKYADGSTPTEQYAGWQAFMKRYFRERIKRGMLVEISPSGYGSRTLQGWHNIYDFTEDQELKYLVKSALDVWWADWAQEQLGGMRGGGKTRLYPGAYALSGHDRNRAMSWFYLGQHHPAHHHETLPVIATTTYRMPLVVMDIALDPEGRGVYENKSRRLGRHLDYEQSLKLSKPNEPVYEVDHEYGGLIRYSYCTPDFIVGSLILENRPKEFWTAISQQNRWHGIIFAGDLDSTLYPRCETNRSTYNAHWAMQNKGTLIAQKLRYADGAKAMRICYSTDLERHEEGGWWFVKAAQAFAAVKIVRGGWEWEDEHWLRCEEEYTPIIFEVARKQDYNGDFDAFKTAILQQNVHFEGGVLRYSGLQDSGDFTFYAESEQLPELNDNPIDLKPGYTFESPFLNEDWASGIVRIHKGHRELIIDVREESEPLSPRSKVSE